MILLQIEDFIIIYSVMFTLALFAGYRLLGLSNLTLKRLETPKTHMVFQKMYFPERVKPWIL